MKIKTCYILMIVAVLISSLGSSVMAQQSDQDQGKMMEAYMKIMAVTENHIYLKERFAGDWDVYTTAWMMPGAEPQKAQNSAHAEPILGGRFLKVDFKGRMFGQPFEGFQILGFDNLKQKYISFWIDNTSTAFYLTEGTKQGTVTIETGDWADPMTGSTMKVKTVMKSVNLDEYIFELFMIDQDGMEFKIMENRALRKK